MGYVPEVAEVLKLEIVKLLAPEFKPFIVTLSAPAKSIKGRATEPLIVLVPLGLINNELQLVEFDRVIAPVSVVISAVTNAVIVPVCTVPVLILKKVLLQQ